MIPFERNGDDETTVKSKSREKKRSKRFWRYKNGGTFRATITMPGSILPQGLIKKNRRKWFGSRHPKIYWSQEGGSPSTETGVNESTDDWKMGWKSGLTIGEQRSRKSLRPTVFTRLRHYALTSRTYPEEVEQGWITLQKVSDRLQGHGCHNLPDCSVSLQLEKVDEDPHNFLKSAVNS